jgi:hypothetical protein
MSFENIIKDSNFYQTSTGDYGFRILSGTDTSTVGESFRSIQVLNQCVLSTTTSVGDAIPNTITLKAGTVIFGKFDSITMVSGKIIAYLAS